MTLANTDATAPAGTLSTENAQDVRLLTDFDLTAIENIESLDENALKRLLVELQGAKHDLAAGHRSHSSTYSSSGW